MISFNGKLKRDQVIPCYKYYLKSKPMEKKLMGVFAPITTPFDVKGISGPGLQW
jgi:hypothetical protein